MHRTMRIREGDRAIFEDLRSGLKSIETRAATPKYKSLKRGDTVTFVCGADRFTRTIRKVHHWSSVDAMVRKVPFKKVMPRAATLAEVKRIYASYPGYTEKIRTHGLIGLEFATILA